MATTKISFSFPADAWPGIVAALAERRREDDPLTPEEYAAAEVKQFVASKFQDYIIRAKQKEVADYIAARIPEVNQATQVVIEQVEE